MEDIPGSTFSNSDQSAFLVYGWSYSLALAIVHVLLILVIIISHKIHAPGSAKHFWECSLISPSLFLFFSLILHVVKSPASGNTRVIVETRVGKRVPAVLGRRC